SAMIGLRIAAWCIAVATAAALITGLLQVLEVLPSEQKDWIPLPVYPFLALALLAPAVVGLRIANEMPRNRIAWILLIGAFLPALEISAEQLVGASWAMQTERASTYPLLFAWPVAVAFVFPDGRLLTRRWMWFAAAAAICFGVTLGVGIVNPFA